MKAVGYAKSLPIDDPKSLEDIEIADPVPGPRDLLVAVEAVSVNPVDTKVRMRAEPESGHKILGYDAAGTVKAVGAEVSAFKPGDQVFYAGDISRDGTNAQFHVVDERIAGRKPASIDMTDVAALPLTAITAWELLFDSFGITEGGGEGDTLLVIGGAGGVGSIMIQIAKAFTKLTVVATASREETVSWCKKMGADHTINHREPLPPQMAALGLAPRYVASLTATDQHFDAIIEMIEPRGDIGMIDDPENLDIMKIKRKSLSFHIEFMFARPMWGMKDMDAQQKLLNRISEGVEAGKIVTTAARTLGAMSAETLKEAHALQESGSAVGKTVLQGIA